jgi:prepilin-type processing-associated H-X9-DG protein
VTLTSEEGAAMGFVQIIEFKTSKLDEMQKVGSEWEAAAGGDSKARRRVLCQDRDHPGRYVNIVFFDSHEEAMQNSELAVTQEYSQKVMALADGPPTFLNLDVLEDVSS